MFVYAIASWALLLGQTESEPSNDVVGAPSGYAPLTVPDGPPPSNSAPQPPQTTETNQSAPPPEAESSATGETQYSAGPFLHRVPVEVGRVDGRADFENSGFGVPDAFDVLDEATQIRSGGHGSFGDGACDGLNCEVPNDRKAGANNKRGRCLTAVFTNPAHFSVAEFGRHGERIERAPVLIYEGMTFKTDRAGRYEVRFLVDAPRVPVILRMQLTLMEQSRPVGTITLPPIRLDGEDSPGALHNGSRTWLARRTGYSHLLRDLSGGNGFAFSISRNGIAEIGQVPEKATY